MEDQRARDPNQDAERDQVVIGGGSGFVGRALASELARRYRVVGISRSDKRKTDHVFSEWRKADLFNLKDAEAALAGARYAIYLVHSMMPSARLTQGSFRDLDLVCADNFARAARKAGVEQIVYLGGLIPSTDEELSPHLASRREVERVLASHGTPITTLRAGLVLGGGGSSFEIMVRLVERLPAMLLPKWTQHRTQAIAVSDVVALLAFAVGNRDCFGNVFDVGAPDTSTYADLMRVAAELLGLHRPMIPVPFLAPSFSRLWVSLITGAPSALVKPLLESLHHEMVARDSRLAKMAGRNLLSTREAMRVAIDERKSKGKSPFEHAQSSDRVVRSVQRMKLPVGHDAAWAASEYTSWLPRALRGVVRVDVDENRLVRFYLEPSEHPILVLTHAPERSTPDRQLFFVSGGLLARSGHRGRFEIRQVLDERTLLTAIHDYAPRLPWFIYRYTQALFHGWVMAQFGRHLAEVA